MTHLITTLLLLSLLTACTIVSIKGDGNAVEETTEAPDIEMDVLTIKKGIVE